jgi:hypothetical protein
MCLSAFLTNHLGAKNKTVQDVFLELCTSEYMTSIWALHIIPCSMHPGYNGTLECYGAVI